MFTEKYNRATLVNIWMLGTPFLGVIMYMNIEQCELWNFVTLDKWLNEIKYRNKQ